MNGSLSLIPFICGTLFCRLARFVPVRPYFTTGTWRFARHPKRAATLFVFCRLLHPARGDTKSGILFVLATWICRLFRLFSPFYEGFSPSKMFTHCPKANIFKCLYCKRRGGDCLNSCRDCRILNNKPNRIHRKTRNFIYIARLLCKKCTTFHIRHTLGQRIFDVKIFTDPRFPEQLYPTAVKETVVREDQKVLCEPKVYALWRCTCCKLQRPEGYCSLCIEENKDRGRDRIKLVNGHLHIIDAFCKIHFK